MTDAPVLTTIAEAIQRMQEINTALPRKDGLAYFDRLYLQVTEAVGSATAGTQWEDPRFLVRLDVVFAGLYFAAADTVWSGAACPVAWRPLIEERAAQHAPIQFALAGMNAHINGDLPFALVQTCEELGVEPRDGSPEHRDFEHVNVLLGQVEAQVAGWFRSGLIADIEDVVPEQVDAALAMWSIVAARELAWEHAKVLWHLRRLPDLATPYRDLLVRTTELAGRAMLV